MQASLRMSPLASPLLFVCARRMSTDEIIPLVEAFLVIEQPRQRLGHWTQALAALDSPMAPPLASIVAYYDPGNDQALLCLRYDSMALGPTRLEFVVEVALLSEVGMIQPAELSDFERRRFQRRPDDLAGAGQRFRLGRQHHLHRLIRLERGR